MSTRACPTRMCPKCEWAGAARRRGLAGLVAVGELRLKAEAPPCNY